MGKNLLSSNISPTCPYNMVNFGPLAAKIISLVWGTPANFNGFCVLAALLHGTPVVSVSQTLRRWTEGATYIRQRGHHVGHWPTFLVLNVFLSGPSPYSIPSFHLRIIHSTSAAYSVSQFVGWSWVWCMSSYRHLQAFLYFTLLQCTVLVW